MRVKTIATMQRLWGLGDAEVRIAWPELAAAGIDLDEQGALQAWAREAGDSDVPERVLAAAKLHVLGLLGGQGRRQALALLQHARVADHAPSMFLRAELLLQGPVISARDRALAEALSTRCLVLRYPPALMARALQVVQGGDGRRARALVAEAARAGDPGALHWLGTELIERRLTAHQRRGVALLEAAATRGYSAACCLLATIHRLGRHGVSPNPDVGAKWQRRALELLALA